MNQDFNLSIDDHGRYHYESKKFTAEFEIIDNEYIITYQHHFIRGTTVSMSELELAMAALMIKQVKAIHNDDDNDINKVIEIGKEIYNVYRKLTIKLFRPQRLSII